MKFFIGLIFLLIPLFSVGQTTPMLVNRGASDYVIVLPNNPSPLEQYVANDLATLIKMMAGAEAPVTPIIYEVSYKAGTPALFIGNSNVNRKYFANTKLRHDGYAIRKEGHNLHIMGYSDTATCYAVYHFAEHGLDCHLYTPTALTVHQTKSLQLPNINCTESPDFTYREVLYRYPNISKRYALWHRLHNRSDMNRQWGMFVHTFNILLPADKYFDSHPEWYSEINGRRVRDGQLCLTNPEVLNRLCLNLQQEIRKNPSAKIWSVSNNDNTNNCTCPRCKVADSIYGGPSGTLINFINQVARRFPDKTISTLAYQYTRHAPQNPTVKPDSNVNIMLCSIESGRQAPIAIDQEETSFRSDLEQWSQLTNNIFLWDYVVQFRNYWNPFPNLHVLQPNLQLFHQHGVQQIFEQGSGVNDKTSWMELRTYIIAQLMWDVDANVDSLIHTFCNGYYGPAGTAVETIIHEMTDALTSSHTRLDIYGYPINGKDSYLHPNRLDRYQDLMTEAYASTEGYITPNHHFLDEEAPYSYRDRLRYFELALDYSIIELAAANVSPYYTFFHSTLLDTAFSTSNNGVANPSERTLNTAMIDRLNQFVADCSRFGISSLDEMGYAPATFLENLKKYLYKCDLDNSLSYGKPVTLAHAYDSRYPAQGNSSLTDGTAGILNYNWNWLGFYGEDFDAVVDLGTTQDIHSISTDFFFYPLSWIFLPQDVIYYVSNNGRSWREVYRAKGNNEPILAKPIISTFFADDLKVKARYVRVVGKKLPTIPDWHRATGNPAWLFTDEIVVR